MNESEVKRAAREWSGLFCRKGIPHVVIGSAAMVLRECDHGRKAFKDIDFLVPENREEEAKGLLVKEGFTVGKNGNYEKNNVTIGIATPKTHDGFPCPTDNSVGTMIDGSRVMKLDGLIEGKRMAINSQMRRIGKRGGYRRFREKSAAQHLRDFCALCHARDKENKKSD